MTYERRPRENIGDSCQTRKSSPPKWVVCAPGPSLTDFVAQRLCSSDCRILAVNDAWRQVPWADALIASDLRWWNARDPREKFRGERLSILHPLCAENLKLSDRKVRLIEACDGAGFAAHEPIEIGFFPSSGQSAVSTAIACFKARTIVLVGFDARAHGNKTHFWGNYTERPFFDPDAVTFSQQANSFGLAKIPSGVRIINATPESALTCFERMSLDAALSL